MAIDDISDRLNRRELRRVSLPGGKEAYTGPGAGRALKALNAEAMTVDNSIIVSEDFDASNAYDMSLYAHEEYHVQHGRPGALGHAIHDAEETAARAVEQMVERLGELDIVFVESGGDNLSATFSPELADITVYVIDVSAGEKIPRKGGPGITRSDLLVINKTDLAEMVGASLEVMDRDASKMRGQRPFLFAQVKHGEGVDQIIATIEDLGGLVAAG